jgi:probable phosphomutase (TIGR03848 family)
MTRVLLIRHALTNSTGIRLTGRLPGVHLNEEGRKQAQLLAWKLASESLSAIYSSPLERAVETATPFAEVMGLELKISENFAEIDFGEWTNLTIDELRNNHLFKKFNSFRSSLRIPGGEMMPEAQLRMIRGIEEICRNNPEKTIAIVSHADTIKSVIAYYAGISLDMMGRIEISPASVSIVEIYDQTVRIIKVNQTF